MIRSLNVAVVVMVALVVGGCSVGGRPSASSPPPTVLEISPSATATLEVTDLPPTEAATVPIYSPAPDRTPDWTPEATQAPEPSPSPAADASVIRAIDAFWLDAIDLSCWNMVMDKPWESMPAMAKEAELIILGRPVGLSEDFDSKYGLPVRVMEIAVDEVLKGTPVHTADGMVRVITYRGGQPNLEIPGQQHLLFLRNVGSDEVAVGDKPTDKQRSWYWLSGFFHNVFANVDGRVVIPSFDKVQAEIGDNTFPVDLQGRDFEELVADVRRVVQNQSDAGRQSEFGHQRPLFAC